MAYRRRFTATFSFLCACLAQALECSRYRSRFATGVLDRILAEQKSANLEWLVYSDWTEEKRDAKRKELKDLLTAAVCSYSGDVHYYKGLHDIASVLLFVVGEHCALRLLRRLVICHLRDCTRYRQTLFPHGCTPHTLAPSGSVKRYMPSS